MIFYENDEKYRKKVQLFIKKYALNIVIFASLRYPFHEGWKTWKKY